MCQRVGGRALRATTLYCRRPILFAPRRLQYCIRNKNWREPRMARISPMGEKAGIRVQGAKNSRSLTRSRAPSCLTPLATLRGHRLLHPRYPRHPRLPRFFRGSGQRPGRDLSVTSVSSVVEYPRQVRRPASIPGSPLGPTSRGRSSTCPGSVLGGQKAETRQILPGMQFASFGQSG